MVQRKKAKLYYDRSARKLPELKSGQTVCTQTHPGTTDLKCRLVTWLKQVAPRSYFVGTDRQTYRRNRKHLRPTDESAPVHQRASFCLKTHKHNPAKALPTPDKALTTPTAEAAVSALTKPN